MNVKLEPEYWTIDPVGNDIAKHPWTVVDRLTDVVLTYVPGAVVDIGVGASTAVLLKHSVKFKRDHYSIDIDAFACQKLKENTKAIETYYVVFHTSSRGFIKNFPQKEIRTQEFAIVLLDGAHNFLTVKMEIDFFIPKMSTGGVIFVHDTMPWEVTYNKKALAKKSVDTYMIRDYLKKRTDVEAFTWPYTAAYCGLTMILKKDLTRPFYRL